MLIELYSLIVVNACSSSERFNLLDARHIHIKAAAIVNKVNGIATWNQRTSASGEKAPESDTLCPDAPWSRT